MTKRITKLWFAYWRAVVGVIFTLAASTLGMAGVGVMFFAPTASVWTAAQGGLMMGAAAICSYVVAKTLKD